MEKSLTLWVPFECGLEKVWNGGGKKEEASYSGRMGKNRNEKKLYTYKKL